MTIGVKFFSKVELIWRGESGAQAYNGGLRAEPPAGPDAEPLVRRPGG